MHLRYNINNKYLLRKTISQDLVSFYYKYRRLPIFRFKDLNIKKSSMNQAGDGVFTAHKIKKGDIIEINKSVKVVNDHRLNKYSYKDEDNNLYISSGLASFYCTSLEAKDSNADFLFIKNIDNYFDANLVIVYATKDIEADCEILYFYGKESIRSIKANSYPFINVR